MSCPRNKSTEDVVDRISPFHLSPSLACVWLVGWWYQYVDERSLPLLTRQNKNDDRTKQTRRQCTYTINLGESSFESNEKATRSTLEILSNDVWRTSTLWVASITTSTMAMDVLSILQSNIFHPHCPLDRVTYLCHAMRKRGREGLKYGSKESIMMHQSESLHT